MPQAKTVHPPAEESVRTQLPVAAPAAGLPTAISFEADAGAGFENLTKDDYVIPIVAILQTTSPQVDPTDPTYIESAKAGQFINTANNKTYTEIALIPCAYERVMNEWVPREEGGGFKGRHKIDSDVVKNAKRDEDNGNLTIENGNVLVDTRNFFCLLVTDTGFSPVVVPFKSTQIKKARQWMFKADEIKLTRADGSRFQAPLFSHIWRFGTVPESNDKGKWAGFKQIGDPQIITDPALYTAAREFRDLVLKGAVVAAEETAASKGGKDIPF